LITEEDLRSAAESISRISDAKLQRKFVQLKEARRNRTRLDMLRQQAELDSLELDQSAYQVASQAVAEDDLPSAAHWYRVAAINDFADAPLQLAMALDALAERYLTKPASRTATREEMDLVADAARWYAVAYAAGDIGAADQLDKLIARHDFTRPRACPAPVPAAEVEHVAAAATCPDGGLQELIRQQPAELAEHIGSCINCGAELGKLLTIMRMQDPALLSSATHPDSAIRKQVRT